MQTELLFFTAGQFAKLHHLNKRTLHYYDGIGLFSPAHKGENGYRYYTYHQSAELEHILALRELGMSIEEIKDYLRCPSAVRFEALATQKIGEIDKQIRRLKELKGLLLEKRDALTLCGEIYDGKIELVQLPDTAMLLTPIPPAEAAPADMEQIMAHLRSVWEYSTYKTGCGCYLSLDKAALGHFEVYDGLFTPVPRPRKDGAFQTRPGGNYLRGYCIGPWEKIPALYRGMFSFAAKNNLELMGLCYELGLNEFAISSMEAYVTQIEIPCRSK